VLVRTKNRISRFGPRFEFFDEKGKTQEKTLWVFSWLCFFLAEACVFSWLCFFLQFFFKDQKNQKVVKNPKSDFSCAPTLLVHSKRPIKIFFHHPNHFFTKLFFGGEHISDEKVQEKT